MSVEIAFFLAILQSALIPRLFGKNGWTLTSAVSINDRGDIVARATNPNFTYVNSSGQTVLQTRSFVLTRTPEGSTLFGLSCVGALIGRSIARQRNCRRSI